MLPSGLNIQSSIAHLPPSTVRQLLACLHPAQLCLLEHPARCPLPQTCPQQLSEVLWPEQVTDRPWLTSGHGQRPVDREYNPLQIQAPSFLPQSRNEYMDILQEMPVASGSGR